MGHELHKDVRLLQNVIQPVTPYALKVQHHGSAWSAAPVPHSQEGIWCCRAWIPDNYGTRASRMRKWQARVGSKAYKYRPWFVFLFTSTVMPFHAGGHKTQVLLLGSQEVNENDYMTAAVPMRTVLVISMSVKLENETRLGRFWSVDAKDEKGN
ncbi:hypothetical protein MVEN_00782800 [Mycena venus]|uniref:Uncharacterized protein n=1 Tax=Mycena venus TaxID=2733690 RepID=A0A8H7D3W4_9AGAR|nr:hypothetical protein MVEN_00782800 [Mycena venus]